MQISSVVADSGGSQLTHYLKSADICSVWQAKYLFIIRVLAADAIGCCQAFRGVGKILKKPLETEFGFN
jgi:hypothetical protein